MCWVLPISLIITGSLAQAHAVLTGEELNTDAIRCEARRLLFAEKEQIESYSRDDLERYVAFRGLRDILTDEASVANVLTSWPVYQELMEHYGEKATTPAAALLIGSLSSVSSRAFEVMAKDEFGADTAYIVDIHAGKDKVRHGSFVQGNGLHLPLGSETLQFVTTNRLLNMLIDPDAATHPIEDPREQLLKESFRVLVPGGQLLMSEIIPKGPEDAPREYYFERTAAMNREVVGMLETLGFSFIVVEHEGYIRDSRYLFDPSRRFNMYPQEQLPREPKSDI